MSLEYLVVSESKEVLKKNPTQENTHNDGDMSKRHRSQLKEIPMAKSETI